MFVYFCSKDLLRRVRKCCIWKKNDPDSKGEAFFEFLWGGVHLTYRDLDVLLRAKDLCLCVSLTNQIRLGRMHWKWEAR